VKVDRVILIGIAGILGGIIGYLLMCFMAWNFDPGTWGNYQGLIWDETGKSHTGIRTDANGLCRILGLAFMVAGTFGGGYGTFLLTEENDK